MICVEGFRAFEGVMKITPKNPNFLPYELYGQWLYKPDTDCWYCRENGSSYPASVCIVISDKLRC